MIGAFLGVLLPWRMVPGVYVWLSLVVAGLSMWRFAREWLPQPQAIVAAALFMVNPYNLVNVYYRSDFAELYGRALLLPLHLWVHCWRAALREGARRAPLLAFIFAAICAHERPGSGCRHLRACRFVLPIVTSADTSRSLQPLFVGAAAMCAGFGLAAVYILPAALERRWVQIGQAVSDNLQPARNFLFTQASDPEFVLFNWKVSWVALGLIVLTGIAAVFAARRRREFAGPWWILFVLSIVSVALLFRPSLILWRLLPNLVFVDTVTMAVARGFELGLRVLSLPRPGRHPASSWMSSITLLAVFAGHMCLLPAQRWFLRRLVG